jgi:prolyl-tRNA editing enzyme YbaK/EbsC (Cys-tRNA(Pro) deacylase)
VGEVGAISAFGTSPDYDRRLIDDEFMRVQTLLILGGENKLALEPTLEYITGNHIV